MIDEPADRSGDRTSGESVTAFVRARHDAGEPAERVLATVKSLVTSEVPMSLRVTEVRSLVDDVVHWTLDAYFDAA